MISMLLADKLYNSVTVCYLCGSKNFHSDKQLFQVAGTGDRTTDPRITKPELYLYTMGDPHANLYSKAPWWGVKQIFSYLTLKDMGFLVS